MYNILVYIYIEFYTVHIKPYLAIYKRKKFHIEIIDLKTMVFILILVYN